MRVRAAVLAAVVLCSLFSIAQTTINVPADQPTIQAGINAANDSDTVLVAPGTYVENINFNGKNITLKSSGGSSATIIDGNAAGSVVTINHGETKDATLAGFTIRNGASQSFAGGIEIRVASPTVLNNVIRDNHGIFGIGIEVYAGSPLIQSNVITGNTQTMGSGGVGGGGIAVWAASGSAANPQIIGNTITNNSLLSGGDGGGISVGYFASPLIQNNYIAGNSVYNNGGGISLWGYNDVYVVQNIVTNNSSGQGGDVGGISASGAGSYHLVGNTLYGNHASSGISEIYISSYNSNAVLANNAVLTYSGTALKCDSASPPAMSHNVIWGGPAYQGSCISMLGVNGNQAVDPAFVNPSAGDFHLQPTSPAIGAGDASAAMLAILPTSDYDGANRLSDRSGQCNFSIDAGVYETNPAGAAFGSFTPFTFAFPDQALNTTSAAQAFQLTNSSGACMRTGGELLINGDFAISGSTCGVGVPPGQSCTVSATFTPKALGNRTGTLAVFLGGAGSPAVALSGNGRASQASLSPASLSFGNMFVNVPSPPQTVTLSNTGSAATAISSVSATGDFSQTNNCGTSLDAGASCSIQVTFTPAVTGTRTGVLTVTSNAAIVPTSVSLTGNGIAPQASMTPSSLSFAGQPVNTTSPAQAIVLQNTGAGPLTIIGIATSGDFAQTSNCPADLPQGASCTIQVTFTPAATGPRSGSLTVNSNSTNPASPVALTGNGTGAQASVSPTSVSFGSVLVNNQTYHQSVTIANNGDAALNVNSNIATAPFFISTSCVGNIAPASSCTIDVAWSPNSPGPQSGTLTIGSNSLTAIPSIPISGTGTLPHIVYSPASLTFGPQKINTASPPQTMTMSNTGDAAYTISSIGQSGEFQQTNNCGTSLAPGASCTISVIFTPAATGTRTGTLSVAGVPGGLGGSASFTGTGAWPTGATSPATLSFATTRVGSPAAAQSATLTNTSAVILSVKSITVSGDYAQTNNCGTSLAAGASCSIAVVFTPSQTGTRTGSVTIMTDAQNASQFFVDLSGAGGLPAASVSSTVLSFTTTAVGAQSPAKPVTLTNSGTVAMNISSIAASANFVQSNNCGVSLAAGASCTVNVAFAPAAAGSLTGQLTIADDASPGTQSVSLSGPAVDFTIGISQTSVSITAGQTASYDVQARAVGGTYSTSIALSCSGAPAGSTCSLTPTTLNAGQNAKLRIVTTKGVTPSGTYVITAIGTANGVSRSDTATLVVK